MTIIYFYNKRKARFEIVRETEASYYSKKQRDYMSNVIEDLEKAGLKLSIPLMCVLFLIILIVEFFSFIFFLKTKRLTILGSAIVIFLTSLSFWILVGGFYFLINFTSINVIKIKKKIKRNVKQYEEECKILGLDFRLRKEINDFKFENSKTKSKSYINEYDKKISTEKSTSSIQSKNLDNASQKKIKIIENKEKKSEKKENGVNLYIVFSERLSEDDLDLKPNEILPTRKNARSTPMIVKTPQRNSENEGNEQRLSRYEMKKDLIDKMRKTVTGVKDGYFPSSKNYLKKKYTVFEHVDKIEDYPDNSMKNRVSNYDDLMMIPEE